MAQSYSKDELKKYFADKSARGRGRNPYSKTLLVTRSLMVAASLAGAIFAAALLIIIYMRTQYVHGRPRRLYHARFAIPEHV